MSLLYAVAIYERVKSQWIVRDGNSSPPDASLSKFEAKTLPLFSRPYKAGAIFDNQVDKEQRNTLKLGLTFFNKEVGKEYHYVQVGDDETYILVINSRKKLEDSEVRFLFANMNHSYHNHGVDLADIVMNPFGYTGKDHYPQHVKKQVEEVHQIAVQNVQKLVQRGEKLENLQEKTEELVNVSEQFEKSSKRLNTCCGGYVRRPF